MPLAPATAAIMFLCFCKAPLEAPVLPEVYMIHARSSGEGGDRVDSFCCGCEELAERVEGDAGVLLFKLVHMLWIDWLRSIFVIYDGSYILCMFKGLCHPRKQCWIYKYSPRIGLFEGMREAFFAESVIRSDDSY